MVKTILNNINHSPKLIQIKLNERTAYYSHRITYTCNKTTMYFF